MGEGKPSPFCLGGCMEGLILLIFMINAAHVCAKGWE